MDFSWILGYARTTFHHSESPVKLPWRDSSSKPLHEVCKSPAITPPCRLAPYLPTGHLQTINSAITKTDVPIHYRRKVFESNDARHSGTFVVDFVSHLDAQTQDKSVGDNDEGRTEPAKIRGNLYCPKRTRLFEDKEWAEIEAGSDDKTPMLVILHGLSGGSYEVYLKQVLAPLTVDCANGQQKWEACVVTARGCAGSAITSGILFNARATWDYRQVVNFLQQKFPKRPLFGLGFSLGANILVNYLGEEGKRCKLNAAVVCSNPWDLNASNLALQRTWMGKEVYSKTMGSNMKNLFRRHLDEFKNYSHINIEGVLATTYLYEFDRVLQCPTWGYPTEAAYYRDASSTEPLLNVRIPLFCINAEDDPVAPMEALPFEEVKQNPYVVLCTTSMGGHLSWFETGGGRWFTRPASNFLRQVAENTSFEALRQQSVEALSPSIGADGSSFDPLIRKLNIAE